MQVGFEWDNRDQVWDKVNEEINELKAQLSGLHQEKMALMQQLLTGKWRVKVDQREAA